MRSGKAADDLVTNRRRRAVFRQRELARPTNIHDGQKSAGQKQTTYPVLGAILKYDFYAFANQ